VSDFAEKLKAKVSGFLLLSEQELSALVRHYELMRQWNRVLNLTRIEDLDDVVERHYAESLFLAAHLPKKRLRIVDIGSGAGFPGFPVAVVRPDCEVTLVEAHGRKAVFLKEATRGMLGVRVFASRAESLTGMAAPNSLKTSAFPYDWMISRAVRWDDVQSLRLAEHWMVLAGADVEGSRVQLPWGNARFLVSDRFT
jgi:16S rRNA (guanine527-N7)-methyltransferase